jgi:hypothetical protein
LAEVNTSDRRFGVLVALFFQTRRSPAAGFSFFSQRSEGLAPENLRSIFAF